MRKCFRKALMVPMITCACISVLHAQDFVKTAYQTRPSNISKKKELQQMELKEVITNLQKKFKIKIVYREKLLDDKTVPANYLENLEVMDAETALKKITGYTRLNFKRTGNSQYSIFETPEPTGKKNSLSPLYFAPPVKGRITAEKDGSPLAGATISLKGNNGIVTVSDAQGNFSLSIPDDVQNPVLLVSSIGYSTLEYEIKNNPPAEIALILTEANTNLNEVVVTALGVKKGRKSIAYAMSELKGSEFTQARENNVANALSGKVAGVNAAGLSTGPGGSSRITIRGNGSLSGSDGNQPLYVINGMPIDNSVPGGAPTINGITSNVDRGDGIAAINPDDIESITVLKGGPAAALYGSRASNGVILITTKKGKAQRGIGLELNSTATFENAAQLPDYQYEYGQGDGGVMPTTLAAAQATGRRSWGAKIDGAKNYVAVDGQTHPYTAQKNNFKHFYQTGSTFTNTIAFTGGNEGIVYRLSASDLRSNGILPKNTYERKTVNLSVNGKLNDKISIEALAQYNLEDGRNRTGAGDALGNPNWTPLMVANTVDVRWLDPGFDELGREKIWNDAAIASNGYFVVNKYKQKDTKNRFIGQFSVNYQPFENLLLKATVSRDFYNYNYSNILPTGTLYIPEGEYAGLESDVSETNGLFTTTYKTNIARTVGLSFMAGLNGRRFSNNQVNYSGAKFTIPYFYSFSNLATSTITPFSATTATNSIFGSADLDYRNMFYLTFSGRQDWFSTLSPKNNSIFYPSIGGTFIASEAFKMPELFNLAKLRLSWAQVGGGAPDPYSINLTYSNVPSSGQPLQNVTTNNITNANLQPYTSTTYEAGLDLEMLGQRLNLDFTYYNRKTTDDIVNTAISSTSGYNKVILNVGELRNSGVEITLSGTPVKNKNFSWNVSYNVANNTNKVIKLAPGLSSIELASTVGAWGFLNHIEGKPFGTIVGTRMAKNQNGDTIFNAANGFPVQTALQPLGNSVAPLTMGLTNDFRYKNFSCSFLLDGKFGNDIFSVMEIYATRLGLMKTTLPGRENGLKLNGVDQNGAPYSRTVPVSGLRTYYDNYKIYSDLFIHDGSFVKLRQVILSYNIPLDALKALKVQSASISFVARNLATLLKHTNNFDPEQSFTNSINQGFESIGLPRTKSYGVNLLVKF